MEKNLQATEHPLAAQENETSAGSVQSSGSSTLDPAVIAMLQRLEQTVTSLDLTVANLGAEVKDLKAQVTRTRPLVSSGSLVSAHV